MNEGGGGYLWTMQGPERTMGLYWMTIRPLILIRDRCGSRMVCMGLRGFMITGRLRGAMNGGGGPCCRAV